jgi:hypothetical protein
MKCGRCDGGFLDRNGWGFVHDLLCFVHGMSGFVRELLGFLGVSLNGRF